MANLAEKVEALDIRLDELLRALKNALPSGHPRGRRGHTKTSSAPLKWVDVVLQFNEISAELKSIKHSLNRGLSAGSHSPSDATIIEAAAEPLHVPHPSAEQARQQESVFADTTESVLAPSPLARTTRGTPFPPPAKTPPTLRDPLGLAARSNVVSRGSRSEQIHGPSFHCSYEDICEKSKEEAKLVRFSSDLRVKQKGYFKLAVRDLPPLAVDKAALNQPTKDHCTTFSCQPESLGYVRVTKGQNQEVTFPEFPLPTTRRESWSRQSLKELWEGVFEAPPRDMLYVVGEPLFPDIELSPGIGLERVDGKKLPGIGTTYVYLSFGVSFSIMHGEDARFRSINLLRSGEHKLWLVVEPAYEKELEQRMRQEFPEMANCSQAVRHLSRAIRPSTLDKWNIRYSLDYCKPGEAIVTEPGAFHQVLNKGANYAVAVNMLYGSVPAVPEGYRFCQKSCDPRAITATHLRPRGRERPLAGRRADIERRPPRDQVFDTQPIIPLKRKAIPAQTRIRKPLVTPQLASLVKAVCSTKALHHLCSMINGWRDRSKPFFANNTSGALAVHLVQAINALEEKSHLTEFLLRFAKVKLSEVIDDAKECIRADPDAITDLIKGLGWTKSSKLRKKLHHYLQEGRRWKSICAGFEGLLCFLPPNRANDENFLVSGRLCLELTGEDIKLFHSLLKPNEFVQPMCRVGKTFEASIWSNAQLPEFKWESEDRAKLSRTPLKELVPLMEEFQIREENVFDVSKYEWSKPDCWPWEWPKTPGWVPPSLKHCDLCDKKACNCIITNLPKDRPQITNEAGKGQGVRAVGTTYRKGQILGELVGEFAPLDTYNDGWPIEFIRPDLDDTPVAQIYPREMGNWVRKVNHSCHPSAEFRVKKISGSWRQMLVAIRDIPHNDEITAFCGGNFLKGQGKECFCDACSAQSHGGVTASKY